LRVSIAFLAIEEVIQTTWYEAICGESVLTFYLTQK
jgi:hypothetical protein